MLLTAAMAGGARAQSPGDAQAAARVADGCLLAALREAGPEATVASVRARCSVQIDAAARASSNGAPGLNTPGSGAPPSADLVAGESSPTQAPANQPIPAGAASVPAHSGIDATTAAMVATPASVAFDTRSVIDTRNAREWRSWSSGFAILPHRPNYLLPISWAHGIDNGQTPGTVRAQETKFQISAKVPVLKPLTGEDYDWGVYIAYTGQFWWQAFNPDRSSPFREYNHEPEVFVAWKTPWKLGNWGLRNVSAGFDHQSNGRSDPQSRSWNRIFAEFQADHPSGWWVTLRPWWRVPESEKASSVANPRGDDNPDIGRYMGNGELRIGYQGESWRVDSMFRRSFWQGGKGAAQVNLSAPTGFSPILRWYVQYFDGYGESLIDYNVRVRRIGVGLLISDWY